MGKRRWGKRLCLSCGHELSAAQGTKAASPISRTVRWECKRCGARFKSEENSFNARYLSKWEWIADDQGRPFLQLEVEHWPIITHLCVERLEKPTRVAPWQAVTPSGARLAGLEVTHGGPLDKLIVELVNQRLDALNRGEEIAPSAARDLRPKGRETASQIGWCWQPVSGTQHRLALEVDGWPVEVDFYLLGIIRSPDSGAWRAITPSCELFQEIRWHEKRREWQPITDSGEAGQALPGGAISRTVAELYNERLALLRANDDALTRIRPRGG